jgi:hypothetical protein
MLDSHAILMSTVFGFSDLLIPDILTFIETKVPGV